MKLQLKNNISKCTECSKEYNFCKNGKSILIDNYIEKNFHTIGLILMVFGLITLVGLTIYVVSLFNRNKKIPFFDGIFILIVWDYHLLFYLIFVFSIAVLLDYKQNNKNIFLKTKLNIPIFII